MRQAFPGILLLHMLLAGTLFSLNHWVALAVAHGDYSPLGESSEVSSITRDESHSYAPPARRFMTTGRIPAEVDDYELRDSRAGIPFLPAALLGGMGRLLGSLEWSFIAADVLFPAIALWLLYWAGEGIIQNRLSRLLVVWATLLIPFGPRNFLWQGYDARVTAPDFARTPQPEISFPLLIAGALITARALRSATNRGTALAGVASAAIVYSYYFYTIAWGMTLGMLLVLALAWKNWAVAKRAGIVLMTMAAGSIPFAVATLRGKAEGGQTNLLARMGDFTHSPHLGTLAVFVVGFLVLWKFGRGMLEREERDARIAVLMLLVLAGIGGLNFQILSGYDAQHEHFWNRLILPVGFFLAGCGLFSALEARGGMRGRGAKFAIAAVLVCVVGNAAARQVYAGRRGAEIQRASRPEMELLRWAGANLPRGCVLGSLDPDMILLIPAMTADFTYVPSGLRSLASYEEIVDRYYDLASLAGLTKDQVLAIASAHSHLGASELAMALGRRRDAQGFADSFANYKKTEGGRRLDYLILPVSMGIPAGLAGRFPSAKSSYANRAYRLIALAAPAR